MNNMGEILTINEIPYIHTICPICNKVKNIMLYNTFSYGEIFEYGTKKGENYLISKLLYYIQTTKYHQKIKHTFKNQLGEFYESEIKFSYIYRCTECGCIFDTRNGEVLAGFDGVVQYSFDTIQKEISFIELGNELDEEPEWVYV